MSNATEIDLRPRTHIKWAALFCLALAFGPLACGEEFSGVKDDVGGAAGSAAGTETGGVAGGGKAGGPSSGDGGKAGTPAGGAPPLAGGPPLGGSPTIGGSAGAGGGSVEPAIPKDGLELWLRVDSGVMAEDGYVTTWKDGSGHGRDALQTASNYRPRLMAGLGGKPALVFDGEEDYLKVALLDADFSAGLSIFMAMQQETAAGCEAFFEASTDSETNDIHFGGWGESLNYEVEENWVNDRNYPSLLAAPQVAVAVHQPGGLAQVRSNTKGVGEGMVNLPPLTPRDQVFIGRSLYGECALFHGAIGELILYSRAVSDAELLEIEKYLQTKWECCGE